MKIFVLAQGIGLQEVEAVATDQVAGVLERSGVADAEGLFAFLGDPEDLDLDREADHHNPLNPRSEVGDLSGTPIEITCSKCKKVSVVVDYQSKSVERQFSPAAKVKQVLAWAKRKLLGNPNEEGTTYGLVVAGTQDLLALNTRLAALLQPGSCALRLTFGPADKIQG